MFLIWRAIRDPETCPPLVVTAAERRNLGRDVLVSMLPTLALIVAVLGSILGGIATPTESASVGAVGATLLALVRGRLTARNLMSVMESTATTTSMVFVILLGASIFGLVFRLMGGDRLVADFMTALPGERLGAIVFVMAVMFVLGFILDTFEIIFVVIPVTAPVLLGMDVDPVWLGVIVAVNLQTSFLTPAVRVLALLPPQRRAELGPDRPDLSRRGAVRGAAGRGGRRSSSPSPGSPPGCRS